MLYFRHILTYSRLIQQYLFSATFSYILISVVTTFLSWLISLHFSYCQFIDFRTWAAVISWFNKLQDTKYQQSQLKALLHVSFIWFENSFQHNHKETFNDTTFFFQKTSFYIVFIHIFISKERGRKCFQHTKKVGFQ